MSSGMEGLPDVSDQVGVFPHWAQHTFKTELAGLNAHLLFPSY